MNRCINCLSAMVVILVLVGYARAQAINPPGSIDLTQPVLDDKGKPLLDETKRDITVAVIRAFDEYKVGDRISDRDKIHAIAISANADAIVFVDQDCKGCAPLTLGWALAEALIARACPQSQMRGEPKSKECTADEEKAESDIITMTSRINRAIEIRGDEGKPPLPSIVLGPKSLALMKDLVAVRFKDRPALVWRIWSAISPTTEKPPEFGKD